MSNPLKENGAGEVLSDKDYLAGVEYIRSRVSAWDPIHNGLRWYCFDTQVLSLCLVTLNEAEKYIAAMPAMAAVVSTE